MLISLDWQYILRTIPLFKEALFLTCEIAFSGIFFALIIGVFCSIVNFYQISFLKRLCSAYVTLFRNTPLMIQLFFMFYALPKLGFKMSPDITALVGLSLLGGSYMAEAFRGGIQAVAKTQIEAGKAIGLNNWQLMRYVILPQAISYCVPALGANCIFLIKETSIFSVIAVMDLMNVTLSQRGIFYKTNEVFLMLVIAYAIILVPVSLLLSRLERKVRYAEFGH